MLLREKTTFFFNFLPFIYVVQSYNKVVRRVQWMKVSFQLIATSLYCQPKTLSSILVLLVLFLQSVEMSAVCIWGGQRMWQRWTPNFAETASLSTTNSNIYDKTRKQNVNIQRIKTMHMKFIEPRVGSTVLGAVFGWEQNSQRFASLSQWLQRKQKSLRVTMNENWKWCRASTEKHLQVWKKTTAATTTTKYR